MRPNAAAFANLAIVNLHRTLKILLIFGARIRIVWDEEPASPKEEMIWIGLSAISSSTGALHAFNDKAKTAVAIVVKVFVMLERRFWIK